MTFSTLIGFPVIAGLLILQSAIVSRLPLLQGSADVVLLVLLAWSLHSRVARAWHWGLIAGLMVGYVSALPFYVPIIGYLAAVSFARLLQRRVWQTPLLAMLLATFVSTLLMQFLSVAGLQLRGDPLAWRESLNLVILPSLLLNMLLALPVYALVTDLANWVYPTEIEV